MDRLKLTTCLLKAGSILQEWLVNTRSWKLDRHTLSALLLNLVLEVDHVLVTKHVAACARQV